MGRKITISEIESMVKNTPDVLDKLFTTIRLSYRDLLELKKAQQDSKFVDINETLRFILEVYKQCLVSGMFRYRIEFIDKDLNTPIHSIVIDSKEGKDIRQIAKEALVNEHKLSEHEADILVRFKIAKIKRVIKFADKNTIASASTRTEDEMEAQTVEQDMEEQKHP